VKSHGRVLGSDVLESFVEAEAAENRWDCVKELAWRM